VQCDDVVQSGNISLWRGPKEHSESGLTSLERARVVSGPGSEGRGLLECLTPQFSRWAIMFQAGKPHSTSLLHSGTKIVSDSYSLASWSCNRIQYGDIGTESCMQSCDV
jgi:hypothetical protein